jgi:hypothetical protein
MNSGPNYCANCGVPLGESETYCFACGARTGVNKPLAQWDQQKKQTKKNGTALIVAASLSLIWGMMAIVFGGAFLILNSILEFDPEYYPSILGFLLITGKIWVISGILSLITAFVIFSKKYYLVAFITCVAASIIALPIGIVGFFVAFLILWSVLPFKSRSL